MTFADDYQLRTSLVTFNKVADAVDGVLTRGYGGTTTGSASAYACAPAPAWASYTGMAGTLLNLTPHASNAGSCTLAVSGLAAVAVRYCGQPLVGGEVVAGVECVFQYDGGVFNLLNHGGGWATWTPGYGASGGMTFSSVTTELAKYQLHGKRVAVLLQARGTTGGAPDYGVHATMPVACASTGTLGLPAGWYEGGLAARPGWCEAANATTFRVVKADASNWTLGSGRLISVRGEYEAA